MNIEVLLNLRKMWQNKSTFIFIILFATEAKNKIDIIVGPQ